MSVPKAFGGESDDISLTTALLGIEALGKGCRDLGLLFGLSTQLWTVQLSILQFGSDLQKRTFLPKLVSGEWIGCEGISEPEAGSDALAMQTAAEKVDGGYCLRGRKCMVTLGPLADVALVTAVTDPNAGRWGLTAFLVERGTPGFEIGPSTEKMGLRTVPFGDLIFDQCVVPEENRLGKEGGGFGVIQEALEYERCCILACQLGALERQLEECVEYARKRRQFGKPVGKFQSVSNRIADMKLRLETAKLLNYKVAWLKERGRSTMLESAMLKLHLSESFLDSSLDAIRIHGGLGYQSEYGVERELRNAVGGLIYAGTSDIQRNIIAGMLGL